jgi:nitrile hydratase
MFESKAAVPQLAEGALVYIPDDWPEDQVFCHIRTPGYVRGKQGRVVEYMGQFPSPEELAFGIPAPMRGLYHIEFALAELWPDDVHEHNAYCVVEIYEHWVSTVVAA